MIEVPAGVELAGDIAREVDFLSIGTNDLIQYTLVIDREDSRIASPRDAYHPAILRMVRRVVGASHEAGKPVTVCGEMAADPAAAAVLLGLGFTSLSVSLAAYPRMKEAIGSLSVGKLRELAGEIMKMESPQDVEDRVRSTIA